MVEIVEARAHHMRELAKNLRPEDEDEIRLFSRPIVVLWRCYVWSLYRRVALIDGRVAAAWGIGGMALGDEGRLWLWTSPEIEKIKITFFKEARNEIHKALAIYPRLVVWTSPAHRKSRNFLSALGFLFEESEDKMLRYAVEKSSGL